MVRTSMGKPYWKKITPLIIVLSCSIGGMAFACLFAFLFSSLSNSYYENNIVFADFNLKYEKTTTITGEVKSISLNDYNKLSPTFCTICNNRGLVFPNTISDGNVSYFCFSEFFYADGRNIYRTELYCNWKFFDQKLFDNEINRLDKLFNNDKTTVYCEDLFSMPSYITEYNYKASFEYAIVDKENLSIHYIYLKGIESLDQIVFDEFLIPTKNLKDTSFPKDDIIKGYYSIYLS